MMARAELDLLRTGCTPCTRSFWRALNATIVLQDFASESSKKASRSNTVFQLRGTEVAGGQNAGLQFGLR